MSKKLIVWLSCLALVVASACGQREGVSPVPAGPQINDSLFIEVMVELLTARNQPNQDTTYYAYTRAQTLQRYKVTQEILERTALRIGQNPDSAAQLWSKIRIRLGSGK